MTVVLQVLCIEEDDDVRVRAPNPIVQLSVPIVEHRLQSGWELYARHTCWVVLCSSSEANKTLVFNLRDGEYISGFPNPHQSVHRD